MHYRFVIVNHLIEVVLWAVTAKQRKANL